MCRGEKTCLVQRPKNLKLSGQRLFTRKKIPDEAHKYISRDIQKKTGHPSARHIRTILIDLKLSLQQKTCPDCFQTVQTVFKPSGQFSNRPDSFQIVRKVFKPSGQFSNCPYQSVTFVWILTRTNIRIYSCQENDTNEYPNIFVCTFLTRTNIRIYLY